MVRWIHHVPLLFHRWWSGFSGSILREGFVMVYALFNAPEATETKRAALTTSGRPGKFPSENFLFGANMAPTSGRMTDPTEAPWYLCHPVAGPRRVAPDAGANVPPENVEATEFCVIKTDPKAIDSGCFPESKISR